MEKANQTLSFTAIEEALRQGLLRASAQRAEGLRGLQKVQRARRARLERETTRLTKRYGAQDRRVVATAHKARDAARLG